MRAQAAGGRLMMLCGDKAYNHEEEVSGTREGMHTCGVPYAP